MSNMNTDEKYFPNTNRFIEKMLLLWVGAQNQVVWNFKVQKGQALSDQDICNWPVLQFFSHELSFPKAS